MLPHRVRHEYVVTTMNYLMPLNMNSSTMFSSRELNKNRLKKKDVSFFFTFDKFLKTSSHYVNVFNGTKFKLNIRVITFIFVSFTSCTISNSVDLISQGPEDFIFSSHRFVFIFFYSRSRIDDVHRIRIRIRFQNTLK